MPYALCPMPYALCPMPYAHEYLIFLRKAIVPRYRIFHSSYFKFLAEVMAKLF